MATVKEFLARVNGIDGVDGCLLVSDNGRLLGHLLETPDKFSSLLSISTKYAKDVMTSAGFTHCRFVSFERTKGYNFHIFPMGTYYLGIIQSPDFSREKMIQKVNHLLSLVKTGSPAEHKNSTNSAERDGSGL